MRLRLITTLVYAALAFVGVATIAQNVRFALVAVVNPYSYEPDLVWPWLWLAIVAGLGFAFADAVRRIAAQSRVGMARYASILLLLGIAFLARKNVTAPARPTIDDGAAHLVARVEVAEDAAYDETHTYTDDKARATQQWPPELRDLGFFRRGGLLLRSRLFVEQDGSGPALAPPDDVRPGDVVLVLSSDRQSYWITVFRLDMGGRITPVVDERGRALVASAEKGHPASRLDPLFPEYPNKEIQQRPF